MDLPQGPQDQELRNIIDKVGFNYMNISDATRCRLKLLNVTHFNVSHFNVTCLKPSDLGKKNFSCNN